MTLLHGEYSAEPKGEATTYRGDRVRTTIGSSSVLPSGPIRTNSGDRFASTPLHCVQPNYSMRAKGTFYSAFMNRINKL